MSRIGKKPVTLESGVTFSKNENILEVTGPKGKLFIEMTGGVDVEVKEDEVLFTRKNESKRNKSLHGLYRSLTQNMVTGVTQGYSKKLDLVGVGFKAELKNNVLLLQLGYSHPVVFFPPEGITIEVPSQTSIVVSGIDKQLVGLIAAKIRSFRKPEPYKGKGVKYSGEVVRRKAGKTAAK